MATLQPIKFSILEFLEKSKNLEIPENISNFSAQEINKILENIHKNELEILEILKEEIEKSAIFIKENSSHDKSLYKEYFKHVADKTDVIKLEKQIEVVKFELLKWLISLTIIAMTGTIGTIIGVLKYLHVI
ncbi:MAG: hypothetical protein RLZZ546_723 [Bacteroidota bacterium]|jgi:hypothetical protein